MEEDNHILEAPLNKKNKCCLPLHRDIFQAVVDDDTALEYMFRKGILINFPDGCTRRIIVEIDEI